MFFSLHGSKICHISISGLFDLMALNILCHMLCSALRWFFNKFKPVYLYWCWCWYVTSHCDLDLWPLTLNESQPPMNKMHGQLFSPVSFPDSMILIYELDQDIPKMNLQIRE